MSTPSNVEVRAHLSIRGAVQGVGFRPYVYRLASELRLTGWVTNSSAGVEIEVEGASSAVAAFRLRLEPEAPLAAVIQGVESTTLDPAGYSAFEIRESDRTGAKSALILPDIAMCRACRAELLDPANRRYRYPFINCTHCGPRFSIVQALPYDRPHTTMRDFTLCDACRREYEDPLDRRFHAQPNACPDCGPRLAWWTADGNPIAAGEEALRQAADGLRQGRIVAVKGLGGFHLMADARNQAAVRALRARKHRDEKPFACMAPSIETIRALCEVSPLEEQLLRSPQAPIVLLRKRVPELLARAVAPANPMLGWMLPYTPLHELLLADLGFSVVATSGNRSEEPICIDEHEALYRLSGLADGFLVHDRPIARHVDDSVVRVAAGQEQVLRRARGYAPFPISTAQPVDGILAVGGHLKNAIALGVGHRLFVSQHIGDLETETAEAAFRAVIDDFEQLYDVRPHRVAHDMHPDYRSTRYAHSLGIEMVPVQHHFAHVAAVMLENRVDPPLLGLSWDGTGYGPDGTIWGGEFIWVDSDRAFHRIGHLHPFLLAGGDQAVREPRRSALGLLFAWQGAEIFAQAGWPPLDAFTSTERRVLQRMLERQVSTIPTTSMGRLFDGVASLCGLCHRSRHEGQAAMALEFAVSVDQPPSPYPYCWMDGPPFVLNWFQILEGITEDRRQGVSPANIAARFHATLVDAAEALAARLGVGKVALGGGCFQNRVLTEWMVRRLRDRGMGAYLAQRVPPNDGGLPVGQAALASWVGGT